MHEQDASGMHVNPLNNTATLSTVANANANANAKAKGTARGSKQLGGKRAGGKPGLMNYGSSSTAR